MATRGSRAWARRGGGGNGREAICRDARGASRWHGSPAEGGHRVASGVGGCRRETGEEGRERERERERKREKRKEFLTAFDSEISPKI